MDVEIIFKTVKILFVKESTEGFSEEASISIITSSDEFVNKGREL